MTNSNGQASRCESRPWAETKENFSPTQQSEWGDISRQCFSASSDWRAARASTISGDSSLDKAALANGVLQFGSINELTGKLNKLGETNLSLQVNDKSNSSTTDVSKSGDKTVEGKAAALFGKDLSAEQKLATVRDLANAGVTSLSYRDSSRGERKLRLEVEAAGNRQMVHLFDSGADGREKIALRGVSNADGTFERERDTQGNFVDYQGKAHAQLVSARPETLKVDAGDKTKSIPSELPSAERKVVPQPQRDTATDSRDKVTPKFLPGAVDRTQFDAQLKDPRVMAAFAGRMASEVGSQGPAAQLAFAEEVMNRAASRNQTIMQALTGSYYPTHNPGRSNNPRYVEAITKAWQEGTDTTYGATGNASGKVGFGVKGGYYDANRQWVSPNQTVRINGERFGYEQVDLNKGWLAKYQRLKAGARV